MPRLIIIFFVAMFFASSCAIQIPPSGGTKDTIPPVVRKSEPENFSTHFHGQEIRITFDEYLGLKDLQSQLIVSPPLKYYPDAYLKKKTLVIHLEDTLLANTTYTMNFGNAIADLREGNPVENFQYVFSTGDVVDSLTVSGTVKYAFDNKTEKGIYVMLYRNMTDSTPLTSLPDYFTKTNEDGTYIIKNISPGSYGIFALKDNNTNYLFDNSEENIGFNGAPVEAGSSGNSMQLFRGKKNQQLLKVSNEEPGLVTIAYAQPLVNETLTFLSDTSALKFYSIKYSEKRDTITMWYLNPYSDSLLMVIQQDTLIDTIAPRLKRLNSAMPGKGSVGLKTQYEPGSTSILQLNRPIEIIFNHPIEGVDYSKVIVSEDSMPAKNVTYQFKDSLKRVLAIDFTRKEETKYTVKFSKGAFRDILYLENDSMELYFNTRSAADYGTMEIKMSAPAKKYYIMQLIDDKEVMYRETAFHSDTTIFYDYLDPKTYRLKLIEDSNSNGVWDTGDYLHHIQPERIFYYRESFTVRANWDVEVKWNAE
jgi:hypothetical protein